MNRLGRIDAIAAAIESGRVLRQPTWSVGPYQSASDGAGFAVLDYTGDIVLVDPSARRVAHLAALRAAEDRARNIDELDRAMRRTVDVRAVDRTRIITSQDMAQSAGRDAA